MKIPPRLDRFLPLLGILVAGGSGLLLLADSVGNPQKVAQHLFLPSYAFGTLAILFILVLRTQQESILSKFFRPFLILITLAVSCVAVLGSVYERLSTGNIFFAAHQLQPARLLVLVFFLFHLTVLSFGNTWWKRHSRKLLLFYPIFVAAALALMRILPFDLFFHMAKDDALFENIQVAILLLGSLCSLLFSLRFAKNSQRLVAGFFLLSALGLFFIAGEEISWGQRLFGFETTEAIAQVNYQNEYTLHNLYFLQHKILYGYILLCILAVTLPWITRNIPALRPFKNWVPTPFLSVFFLFPLWIYKGQLEGSIRLPWAEAAEMFFYTGIVFWLVQVAAFFTHKNSAALLAIKKVLFAPFVPQTGDKKKFVFSLSFSTAILVVFFLGFYQVSVAYQRFLPDQYRAQERVKIAARYAETPCGPIEYAEIGVGAPLLIIHGANGGYDQGIFYTKILGRENRWIAPSRFGFLGAPVPENLSAAAQAKAYSCLLESLQIDKVGVVGVSLGGPSAVMFAQKYPEKVSSLTLLSTANHPINMSAQSQHTFSTVIRQDFIYWVLLRNVPQILLAALDFSPAIQAQFSDGDKTLVQQFLELHPPLSARAKGLSLEEEMSQFDTELLRTVQAPTLIVHAQDDRLLQFEHAQFAAERIPSAELFPIERGGHLAWMLEMNHSAVKKIQEFLDTHN